MPTTYKRTRRAAVADDDAGLPQLTEKQELFCLGLLDGKSPLEAYESAYNPSKMTIQARRVAASKLKANPKIRQTILYYQRNSLDESKVSLEKHLAELARGREIAYELGQASAGIQAEHYRGKVSGLYEDKLRLQVGPSDDALLSQIAALLGVDMANTIGEALGVEIEGQVVEIKETKESKLLRSPSTLSD